MHGNDPDDRDDDPDDTPDTPPDEPPPPRIDGTRLNRHLAELSRFGANPQGGVTRLAYSDADRQAREYVLGLMRDGGLRDPRVFVYWGYELGYLGIQFYFTATR